MRKKSTENKAKKLAITILVLSIISLVFLSLIPWITTSENDFVKDDLYFNLDMMSKSNNYKINDIADNLNLISLSFWAIIILGIIVYIGATILVSKKFSLIGNILLLIGCLAILFSVFSLYLQFNIIKYIDETKSIAPATIYPSINYSYLLLITSIIIVIFTAIYTGTTIYNNIKKFTGSIKEKNDKKEEKKSEPKVEEPVKIEKVEQIKKPIEPITDQKRIQMENWLSNQVNEIEKQTSDKNTLEPTVKIELKQPFPEEKPPITEEKSSDSDEIPVSKSFEDALSTAIQKKQTEINVKEPISLKSKNVEEKINDPLLDIETPIKSEKSSDIVEPIKKSIKVRCPQCNHIFSAEKEEGITKIKCPDCGKEGVIK